MRLSGNFGRGCDADILSPPSMKEEKQDYHTENSTNKSRTVIVGCLIVFLPLHEKKLMSTRSAVARQPEALGL